MCMCVLMINNLTASFLKIARVCVGGTNSVSTVIVLLLAVIVSKPWSAGVP